MKALHGAGIEVILDVVYNHTVEGLHVPPLQLYMIAEHSTPQGSSILANCCEQMAHASCRLLDAAS